jgi:dTMP kinase
MTRRGRFVVIEGGEAVGKTTQSRLLAARLGARLTREPGGTDLGERLRALLLDPDTDDVHPMAELLLMVAARAQHVSRVIEPTLESGVDVVCDRFSGSTVAYQGYGRGLPLEDVERACALGSLGLVPDLTVLLDTPRPAVARRRSRDADAVEQDRIERAGERFHERVRAGFLELGRQDGWVVVDASGEVDDVARDVAAAVTAVLGDGHAPRACLEPAVRGGAPDRAGGSKPVR